eukprot:9558607-Alexandrium_andersonii.AAC.1
MQGQGHWPRASGSAVPSIESGTTPALPRVAPALSDAPVRSDMATGLVRAVTRCPRPSRAQRHVRRSGLTR